MQAVIKDNKFIYLRQMTQGVEDCVVQWFSVRDPKYYNRRGLSINNYEWDGWYRRYHTKYQRLALPFLNELKKCCEKNNLPLEISDERNAPTYPAPKQEEITNTFIDGIILEDYQVRALQAACNDEIGVIVGSTGSGKTECICGLVKMFRCPTLIITEQIIVLNQIVEKLKIRNVVHRDDIGLFCSGHLPDGNLVVVGSIQSVSTPSEPEKKEIKLSGKSILKQVCEWTKKERERRTEGLEPYSDDNQYLLKVLPKHLAEQLIDDDQNINDFDDVYVNNIVDYANNLEFERRKKWFITRKSRSKIVQDFIRKCDLCIIDEADTAVSQQFARLFKFYFNGRRRYGLTGTPYDVKKPVQGLLLKEHLGSVISEVRRAEVEEAGRIIPIKFYMIVVGDEANKTDARTYDIAMKEEIVENVSFHKLVAKIVKQYENDGTLILVDTSPIEPLGYALEQIIPNAKFIFGKTSKKKRIELIQKFESRELKVLIGSKILKRGFDLKGGCENLIIVGSGGLWSDFNQKVGRAVRLNSTGRARVFAFLYLNNKYLYKHSREHLKAVVDMGYESRVITNGVTIDGRQFIKSRFKIPK